MAEYGQDGSVAIELYTGYLELVGPGLPPPLNPAYENVIDSLR